MNSYSSFRWDDEDRRRRRRRQRRVNGSGRYSLIPALFVIIGLGMIGLFILNLLYVIVRWLLHL